MRVHIKVITISFIVCRKHLEEELFAKEAALTGKLHMEKERQHLDWLSKTNNEWNKQSASLRLILYLISSLLSIGRKCTYVYVFSILENVLN